MTDYKMGYYCKSSIIRAVTVIILAVLLVSFVSIDAYSKSVPTIAGEVVSAQPNDTVKVRINLSNNPGIVSATIYVSFDDSVFSLIKVTDGGLIGAQSHKPELTSPYTLVWVNDTATKNYTSNGTIATLYFKVRNTATYGKTYPITICYNYENYDVYDKDINIIRFQTINGAVKVSNNRSFILGDANRDSKVTIVDTGCIQEYITYLLPDESIDIVSTDVDEDGYTTIIDVTFIQRYLAEKYTPYPIGKTIK